MSTVQIRKNIQKFLFGIVVDNTQVWDLQRMIFTIILTLLLIKPTSNAIFLTSAGIDNLPIAYMMLAVVALAISWLYNILLAKFSPIKMFYGSMQASILMLLVLGLCLFIPGIKIFSAYAFYIFTSMFGIFAASQFWILSNQIFNAREARKYFGIIGFGAIAGGILGGYLASFLTAFISNEWLPVIGALFLLETIRIIRKIGVNNVSEESVYKGAVENNIIGPLRLILNSKHLSFMALVIAISVFVSKMIDFQFGYFASQAFPIEEDLTQFYGISFSSFNIIAITIQVFLTTRVVGKWGIGYSLLIMPVILVFNAGILVLIPTLIAVVGMKLTDASLKQSINKAAMELTMMPTPEDVKLRTKTFMDVFIDSFATGISGLILIMVLQVMELPNRVVTIVIIIAILIWLFITNKMRGEYKKVFRQSLKLRSQQTTSSSTILESYKNILSSGSDFQIVKTLKSLLSTPLEALSDDVVPLLNHENYNIVRVSLEYLLFTKTDYTEMVIPLLEHKNQNVRILAFEYIINHQSGLDPDFLLSRINHQDYNIRIIALAAYSKQFSSDDKTLNVLRIKDRLSQIIRRIGEDSDVAPQLIIGVLKTISYGKYQDYYHIIDQYLEDEDPLLFRHAVLAAGETKALHFFKKLTNLLNHNIKIPQLYMAMAKFHFNLINEVAKSAMKQDSITTLQGIPNILELIPTNDSVQLLEKLLEHRDLDVKHQAIKSLSHLRDKFPLLKVNKLLINRLLLEETIYTATIFRILSQYNDAGSEENAQTKQELMSILRIKIDENLRTVFELLHIIYPPENYLELYGYVRGNDDTLRNNAIEYLDNNMGYDLKKYIIPLLENYTSFQNSGALEDISFEEMKRFLLSNSNIEIRTAAKSFFNAIQ